VVNPRGPSPAHRFFPPRNSPFIAVLANHFLLLFLRCRIPAFPYVRPLFVGQPPTRRLLPPFSPKGHNPGSEESFSLPLFYPPSGPTHRLLPIQIRYLWFPLPPPPLKPNLYNDQLVSPPPPPRAPTLCPSGSRYPSNNNSSSP